MSITSYKRKKVKNFFVQHHFILIKIRFVWLHKKSRRLRVKSNISIIIFYYKEMIHTLIIFSPFISNCIVYRTSELIFFHYQ